MGDSAVEALLKRDRTILIAACSALTLVAAVYTVFGVGMGMSALEMTGLVGAGEMMMQPAAWTPAYGALVFLMWWVMMIAMMTPSAAPMILLYAAVKRRAEPGTDVAQLTATFGASYLAVWALFSALGTGLQWGLELRGQVSPGMMTVTSSALGAAILIAAGLYQFTPAKQACLAHCRQPANFLAQHHRPGTMGAFRLGVLHGAYCLGCCWSLMVLLFFGGIMNLYWITGLALLVLAEKVLPGGDWIARIAGVVLALSGFWILAEVTG